ncbi:YWFCY domain-containing protein [Spirosoma pollinicola]|uniref:YWFCY domain-containing protein n=1 Tax=Spirosoma pollinicola TaxID=2057025 RepID=A0A2K8Z989_9BACT|nr:YWFCY domain-containing protein [Spirosoma pollinicola]AUD06435.1 hypothetical protein CWM47_34110 [Spirosoma pollinicola]
MRKDIEQDKESAFCDYEWLPYALLIFHYYVIGNRILQTMNLPHQFMDRIVVRLEETEEASSLFIVTWRIKLLILFLILLQDFVYLKYSSKPVAKTKLRKGITLSLIGLMLFWGSGWMLKPSNLNEIYSTMFYISLTVVGLFLIKRSLTILVPILGNNGYSDPNDSSDWRGGPDDSPAAILPRMGRIRQQSAASHP